MSLVESYKNMLLDVREISPDEVDGQIDTLISMLDIPEADAVLESYSRNNLQMYSDDIMNGNIMPIIQALQKHPMFSELFGKSL